MDILHVEMLSTMRTKRLEQVRRKEKLFEEARDLASACPWSFI